jgi:hypothetical protein
LFKLRKSGQGGFVLSVELCILIGLAFCMTVVCATLVGTKVLGEYGDIGSAIGSMSQSYFITGIAVGHPNDPNHPTNLVSWAGSGYNDFTDFCDEAGCGLQVCVPPTPEL